MEAYCFKCRKKVEIKNATTVILKNNKPATQGICPTCSSNIFSIGKK